MKLKSTFVAFFGAMTFAANAAIIFDTTPRNDQANFVSNGTVAGGAGQTFNADLSTVGAEVFLSSIRVDNRSSGAFGTDLYLAVYENDATDGTTWTPGALVGVSTNTQNTNTNGGIALWNFSLEELTDGQNYLFTFTDDAAGTSTVDVGVGVLLSAGNSDQSAFSGGAIAFGGAHSIAAQITTSVPEPSSTALIGLAGLGLVLRRRV